MFWVVATGHMVTAQQTEHTLDILPKTLKQDWNVQILKSYPTNCVLHNI